MNKQNIYFIVLIAISGLFSLYILWNFITILLLAYVFATLTRPVFNSINKEFSKVKYLKKVSAGMASFATIVLFLIVIVTPITIILSKVVVDTQAVYLNVVNGGFDLNNISERFDSLTTKISPDFNFDLNKVAASVSGFLVGNIGGIFAGTVDIALKGFLFIFSMFYFLKDGRHFRLLYETISPLKKENDDKIFHSIKTAIHSIMIGSLTVATLQGFITGIGFWMFGVPNPFFFGTLAGLLALIPGLGAPIVWIPAAAYLFITKTDSFVWIYQVIWGVFAVGLIDNILGPKVINKGIKIHPLFILLAIIGGIIAFGPEGFIFGPLILGTFVAIIKVWSDNNSIK